MSAPVLAWIGLGGNVGDPLVSVRAALEELDRLPQTRLARASRLYRTPAWCMSGQPDFINAVARLETSLGARELLDGLLDIERGFGRERRERWGPRVLDLDLLLYGDAVIDEPGLRVPHPHLHERAFALVPLLEIDPLVVIPGRGSASETLALLDSGDIEVVG
jgi:2-amino-4-hydroxy-6-hydroxymethyldihydropteridine diphosphokinase